ncbi:MAG: hypothetical protein L0Z63_01845 [Actinobacteria bacterium]|nr:hypothetical protein [Actinomycetota bacterium]
MHQVHIPVTVDAERDIDGEAMLRATYFVVTTEAPASVWAVELPPLAGLQGLGALGVLGVVYSAVRPPDPKTDADPDLFIDPDDIAALFALEKEGPLTVQLEDVWLPKTWCERAPVWGTSEIVERLGRGEVLRVELGVFQLAYRYTAGDITLTELMAAEAVGKVLASPSETRAVNRWAELQIEEARRAFPEKKIKLRYRVE